MKRYIKASRQLTDEELEAVWDIADSFCVSHPRYGDWDSDTREELVQIAEVLDCSTTEAKQVMKDVLGFEEDDFMGII